MGIGDWGFGIGDWGLGIGDWGFGIRDSGFGIRDSGFGIRDSGGKRLRQCSASAPSLARSAGEGWGGVGCCCCCCCFPLGLIAKSTPPQPSPALRAREGAGHAAHADVAWFLALRLDHQFLLPTSASAPSFARIPNPESRIPNPRSPQNHFRKSIPAYIEAT
ncbi:hypothetical protein EA658_18445 [Pseudoxanthomonas winnipegensis]|uniref:Uncharacterized protein n=1 Tax=Pseudoxanthomonas winnipegensis TaxID=2480810 RepID=A0ABY1WA09_9GAMM|nr:hypothetical protein EA658_18445 [Pseudoxanthomonas winnipegensis]